MVRTTLSRILESDGATLVLIPVGLLTFSTGLLLQRTVVANLAARERTRRLEAQLEEQEVQLAHLERISQLGEMAAAVAHELRQPLAAVVASAETAQRLLELSGSVETGLSDIVDDVLEGAEHAQAIIDQLHAMSRRTPAKYEELSINDLVMDSLFFLHRGMESVQVRPTVLLGGEIPRVRGDRVQLRQVITNLVMNACDAMSTIPAGSRVLNVQTRRIEPDQIAIDFSDRGPGLSPEALAKLFQPFNTTKTHGLGLGLSISRSIMQNHLGGITGQNNREGPGATFTLTLPTARAAKAMEGDSDDHAPDDLSGG